MEWFNAHISSKQTTLKHVPEVPHRVCVVIAAIAQATANRTLSDHKGTSSSKGDCFLLHSGQGIISHLCEEESVRARIVVYGTLRFRNMRLAAEIPIQTIDYVLRSQIKRKKDHDGSRIMGGCRILSAVCAERMRVFCFPIQEKNGAKARMKHVKRPGTAPAPVACRVPQGSPRTRRDRRGSIQPQSLATRHLRIPVSAGGVDSFRRVPHAAAGVMLIPPCGRSICFYFISLRTAQRPSQPRRYRPRPAGLEGRHHLGCRSNPQTAKMHSSLREIS
jgi:hypothetical protein